ncbi:metal ABC transporter ATP-binding protein [Aeromicrobium phragmitis]|uniref:Metal ABC transporter ATP-binding protein n=1 Tax=Aeromicrobium phragmitis TaxID=2478914 RepID=A0A3L8PH43_9ACTN|nr:metal ABC transporter ATP-binding protein [Aeromicrobium phragmitis]RLV54536.1 metal ABC transporter ATP-binding protein [Aeromicrobium phragmitis]
MTAIDVRSVRVRRGDATVLHDVSVQVEPGVVCALIGMNGSGKTTLFDTLADRTRPIGGEVRILGESPARARRRAALGYVPQSERIDWDFPVSVREVVAMGRQRGGRWTNRISATDRAAVDEAIARVGLLGLEDRQIGQLSGGQRKRAFVARGLAQQAQVLLLDEPFAGVDLPSEMALRQVVGDAAASGVTVLVSTHDVHGLADWCDAAVILRAGRVVTAGPAATAVTPEYLAQAFGWEGDA